MSLFNDKTILRQIIISHYDQPNNKLDENEVVDNEYINFHNKSASCIDDITIYIKFKDGIIADAKFSGLGCAISTSSSDIFCDILKNKTKDEAIDILANYKKMINNEEFDQNKIGELIAFKDIYQQPNRIKCSLIGYDAVQNIIKDITNDK